MDVRGREAMSGREGPGETSFRRLSSLTILAISFPTMSLVDVYGTCHSEGCHLCVSASPRGEKPHPTCPVPLLPGTAQAGVDAP